MIGKQFGFFLAPSDQLEFERELRTSGDIVFLNERPSSPRAEELPTTQILKMGEEPLGVLIAQRADLRHLRFLVVKNADIYVCDTYDSLAVEFSRCYVADRFIRAGRLYHVDKYWDRYNNLTHKPTEFIDWAARLYKAAKKSLVKVEQGYFAGKEALELRAAGVAFEGLDIEIGSIPG